MEIKLGLIRRAASLAFVVIVLAGCTFASEAPEASGAGSAGSESGSTASVGLTVDDEAEAETEAEAEQASRADVVELNLTRGYDDLRYVIEGTAGRVDVTWTGRLGGGFEEAIRLTEGRHEIAVGSTVDGVLPSIGLDGGDEGDDDLAALNVAIFDGDELLHRCASVAQPRRSIRCADGRLHHASDPVDIAVEVSVAAQVSISMTGGHRTHAETLAFAEPGVVEFNDVAMTSVFATAWNEDGRDVAITISIDGEQAARAETSAGVSLASEP